MNPHRPMLYALLAAGILAVAIPAHAADLQPALRSWTRDSGHGLVTVTLLASTPLARAADILTAPGEKRLRVVLQQRLSGDQVAHLLLKDVEKASPAGEFAAHLVSLMKLGEAFGGRKELAAGHSFGFQFVPGEGTRLLVDDQPVGAPVADPGFFSLVLRPWLAAGAGA